MPYPSVLDLSNANDALARLAEGPISAFAENSPKARAVARLYPRVRGLLFSAVDWPFATARADLQVNSVDVYPWAFEFLLPQNVARARMVLPKQVAGDGVGLDPIPFEEGISADGFSRVIRADVSPSTLVYTMEIIDPTLWDTGFTSAFTVQLAAELALPVTGSPQLAVAMREQAAQAIQAQLPSGQVQAVTAQRQSARTVEARGG